MPREPLQTNRGEKIGDGLDASLKSLMVKVLSASMNNGRDKDATAEELLAAMDSILEIQAYARMIHDGQLDELIARLEEDGFIPPQLKPGNGNGGR
jgi:hypothetical protein